MNGFSNDGGSFSKTLDQCQQLFTSDYIEVDTAKKYYQSIIAKSNNASAKNYIGIAEYDCDKNWISDSTQMYVKDSLTYLSKDLENGDTEVYLNDISGFITNNIQWQNNGLIFWNYKDSTGYQYPELTYSQNVYFNLYDDTCIDVENNKILLKQNFIKYNNLQSFTVVDGFLLSITIY